jgi:hypothetical protein
MPPKKQRGGMLIDPMMNLNLMKASEVKLLSSPAVSYNSSNYLNMNVVGGSKTKTKQKTKKPSQLKKTKK